MRISNLQSLPMTTSSEENSYNKNNPYSSQLLVNRMLTEGSDKETRHFELSLKGSGLRYEPGDSLGVLPLNCSGVVDDLLTAVGFSGNEEVALVETKINLRDFNYIIEKEIQIPKKELDKKLGGPQLPTLSQNKQISTMW